jgi:hypothetical protein
VTLAPLPPLVTDLATRLGVPLSGADAERAQAALEDATALALAEVPHLAAQWLHAAPEAAHVVILKAARREWENPQGIRSETVDDHSATVAITSGVYLTASERATLARVAGARGFTGSIRTPSAYSPEIA